jgi:poly(3-hydroxybutyrate) depolymerase
MHEMNQTALNIPRSLAEMARLFYKNPLNPFAHTTFGKTMAATMELFERSTRRYARPEWDIDATMVDGNSVAVEIASVCERPFCRLLHFQKLMDQAPARPQPRLLVVAPMAGHYATVLRGTVKELLPDHDVYLTDWTDARLVPVSDGSFDLDDYIDYLIAFMHLLKDRFHVLAVCQSVVPVLSAVARMEGDGDPHVPRSMILIGGTIDTRVNPTVVNGVVEGRGLAWYQRNAITKVPYPNPGFMRDVYPGFYQLRSFLSLDLEQDIEAHRRLFTSLVKGDVLLAQGYREFYDEYLALMDLTAEFFLQTLETVFIRHALATGDMKHRGIAVDPAQIRRVGLMTIEGEHDRIASVGQTQAAHGLCVNIPRARKAHHVQPDVGHYGVFNGVPFNTDIRPKISEFVQSQH